MPPAPACARTCCVDRAARSRRASSAACVEDIGSGSGGVGTSSEASWSTRRSTRSGSGRSCTRYRHGTPRCGEQLGDGLVGGDHQVLDQAVGLGLHARRGSRTTLPRSSKLELGLRRSRRTSAPLRSRRRCSAPRPRARDARAARPTAPRARSRAGEDAVDAARSPGARRSGSASGRRRRARRRAPRSSSSTVTAARSTPGTQRAGVAGERVREHRLDRARARRRWSRAGAPRGRAASPRARARRRRRCAPTRASRRLADRLGRDRVVEVACARPGRS